MEEVTMSRTLMQKNEKTPKRGHLLGTFLLFICLTPGMLLSQSQNLPLAHWAYPFLDRLQTKGLFLNSEMDTRPYARDAVADMIIQIDAAVRENPMLLSEVESRLFQQLKGEFYEEIRKKSSAVAIAENEYEPHLFTYREKDLDMRMSLLLGEQLKTESKMDVEPGIPGSTTFLGLSVRIDLKHSMAIFAEGGSYFLSDVDSVSNTNFSRGGGLPVTEKALIDVAVTNNASAYAVFSPPWFDLQFGRALVEWGPGARGNLMLSRNSNFYDLLKLTFRYSRVKFEHFHALLNAEETKYIAAHRLEIRPVRNLQLALSESVIYGNRAIEPLYLNPFMAIQIAERHLGNKDNNTTSFDGTLFLPRYRLKVYGELFLDDFSFAKNIFNNFVNKWAILMGGFWVDPFGLRNSALRVEFTRIQPRVYSHVKPVNTYSNYGFILGHWLGPDADSWYIGFEHLAHKNLKLQLSIEQRRRGSQNDITIGERPENDIINFLDGVVRRNRILGLSGRWQMHRDIFLKLNYEFIRTTNLAGKAGVDQTSHRLFVDFSLNY